MTGETKPNPDHETGDQNIESEETSKKSKSRSKKDDVREIDLKLQESDEKLLRLRAEFDNYRKRVQRDIADVRTLTKISTIEEILPVMDHFHMAMTAANTSDDIKTLKEGMNLILVEFERCFKNLGIDKVPTEGQLFDPSIHEAITSESSAEIKEEYIIREWKAGYRIGERLLRPAMVVVSSGKETTVSDGDGTGT